MNQEENERLTALGDDHDELFPVGKEFSSWDSIIMGTLERSWCIARHSRLPQTAEASPLCCIAQLEGHY